MAQTTPIRLMIWWTGDDDDIFGMCVRKLMLKGTQLKEAHMYIHTHSIIVPINVQSKCQLKWPKPRIHRLLAQHPEVCIYNPEQSKRNRVELLIDSIVIASKSVWNGMEWAAFVFYVLVREWMYGRVNGLVSRKGPKISVKPNNRNIIQ